MGSPAPAECGSIFAIPAQESSGIEVVSSGSEEQEHVEKEATETLSKEERLGPGAGVDFRLRYAGYFFECQPGRKPCRELSEPNGRCVGRAHRGLGDAYCEASSQS